MTVFIERSSDNKINILHFRMCAKLYVYFLCSGMLLVTDLLIFCCCCCCHENTTRHVILLLTMGHYTELSIGRMTRNQLKISNMTSILLVGNSFAIEVQCQIVWNSCQRFNLCCPSIFVSDNFDKYWDVKIKSQKSYIAFVRQLPFICDICFFLMY